MCLALVTAMKMFQQQMVWIIRGIIIWNNVSCIGYCYENVFYNKRYGQYEGLLSETMCHALVIAMKMFSRTNGMGNNMRINKNNC